MTNLTDNDLDLTAAEMTESMEFALRLAGDADVARRFRARQGEDDLAQDLGEFARLVAMLADEKEGI